MKIYQILIISLVLISCQQSNRVALNVQKQNQMDRIQITAKFQIEPKHLKEFKQLADSCIKIVQQKDKGTLQYDWFFNEEQTECAVRETYLNSEALLEHIEHVGEPLGGLFEISVFTAEIYGNPSMELKDKIQGEGIIFYKRFIP